MYVPSIHKNASTLCTRTASWCWPQLQVRLQKQPRLSNYMYSTRDRRLINHNFVVSVSCHTLFLTLVYLCPHNLVEVAGYMHMYFFPIWDTAVKHPYFSNPYLNKARLQGESMPTEILYSGKFSFGAKFRYFCWLAVQNWILHQQK